jgi:hypothetical protein
MNTEQKAVDVLPSEVTTYLRELAADIVANGGLDESQSIEQAMAEAHARRQAFAQEMVNGVTDRAKKVRAVLSAHVYGQAIARGAIRQTFDRLEDAERRGFVLAQAVQS